MTMDRSQSSPPSSPEAQRPSSARQHPPAPKAAPPLKVVVFRLDGDLTHQGFKVELEVGMVGQPLVPSYKGQLTPMPQLVQQLAQWEQDYQHWGIQRRIRPKEVVFLGPSQSKETCQQSAQTLEESFNQWLQSPDFLKLDVRLRELVHQDDDTLVMLRTDSEVLRKLPWHKWPFIDRYANSEIVLSGTQVDSLPKPTKPPALESSTTVRILAILGDATDIDVERDRLLLEQLPHADVTFLAEPDRDEINDQLWNQPWDILFFAGHSHTEGEQGRICINPEDSLTLSELKYGLRKAIQQGLQLAIFNSCDGLGLAYELEKLSLPHLIVMREPVPDKVAQAFLTYFLPAFAQGHSLYQAVREARERLQGMENDFPCASWLPMVYDHPVVSPPMWLEFQGAAPTLPAGDAAKLSVAAPSQHLWPVHTTDDRAGEDRPLRPYFLRSGLGPSLLTTVLISLVSAGLVIGGRSLGLLQQWELNAFDHFIRRLPAELSDDRLLVITVSDADIAYQDAEGFDREGSLSDEALEKLLDIITPHQPRVIASDIYHDFEFEPSLAAKISTQSNFIGLCQIAKTDWEPLGIQSPPGVPPKQLGFSDIPFDPTDNVIRRQILIMQKESAFCDTTASLNWRIVLHYLAVLDIHPVETADGTQMLNQMKLPRLGAQSGGYQLPIEEDDGYQVLIHYQKTPPKTISLEDALNPAMANQIGDLVRDRIVLIGLDRPDSDMHRTPFDTASQDQQTPGVIIQAQMVSQLLSAVLDDRPLLWWWPEPLEQAWVILWALLGGGVGYWGGDRPSRSRFDMLLLLGLITTGGLGGLGVICYMLFAQGGWIPLVPAAIAFISAEVGVVGLRAKQRQLKASTHQAVPVVRYAGDQLGARQEVYK